MKKRKARILVFILLFFIAAWFTFFIVDTKRVSDEKEPLFCIETSENHFTGLGYSFDIYPHPITGKSEYVE